MNYVNRYKNILHDLNNGDTLSVICSRYNVSPRTIRRAIAWGKANNQPNPTISNNTKPRKTPALSNKTMPYPSKDDDINAANEFLGGLDRDDIDTSGFPKNINDMDVNLMYPHEVKLCPVDEDSYSPQPTPKVVQEYKYLKVGGQINIQVGNTIATYDSSTPQYDELSKALDAKDWWTVKEIVEEPEAIEKWASQSGDVEFRGGELYYKGFHYTNSLVDRIKECMKKGAEPTVLLKFFENLADNPLIDSVQQLFRFLEHNNLPLTPDGHFLAYKKVRSDYKDIHSGKMDNRVGCIVEMPRNLVQHDKDQTCSSGLHFCSRSYLSKFGRSPADKVIVLKINPKDVVSIPTDYNNAKGRACRYEVVADLPEGGAIPDGYTAEY